MSLQSFTDRNGNAHAKEASDGVDGKEGVEELQRG